MDGGGQRVGVGALELGDAAIVEDALDDGMCASDHRQRLFVGGELAGGRLLRLLDQLEFVEEHFAELLVRVHVELASGQPLDVGLGGGHLLGELHAEVGQHGGVDPDAFQLHRGERGQHGHFDFVENFLLTGLLEHGLQFFAELPRHVGVLGGVAGDLRHRHVGHAALVRTLGTDERRDADGRIAEEPFGQVVHAVALVGFDQGVGDHGVEERLGDGEAMGLENGEVELEVVADLQSGGSEERGQG